jgi:hypothetical protein
VRIELFCNFSRLSGLSNRSPVTVNHWVRGSSPRWGAIKTKPCMIARLFAWRLKRSLGRSQGSGGFGTPIPRRWPKLIQSRFALGTAAVFAGDSFNRLDRLVNAGRLEGGFDPVAQAGRGIRGHRQPAATGPRSRIIVKRFRAIDNHKGPHEAEPDPDWAT